jgi:dCTP deaminase
MILSDTTIAEYINSEKIKIFPYFNQADIRPTGIRIHLGSELLIPCKNQVIDLSLPHDIKYEHQELTEEGYLLEKNNFILASTFETIQTSNNIVCHIEGRSTIARLGLSIHCTSGIMDNNHDQPRAIVLELKNLGVFDLLLKPNIPIGMVLFSELSEPITQKSQDQYRNQSSVRPPNMNFRIFKETKFR